MARTTALLVIATFWLGCAQSHRLEIDSLCDELGRRAAGAGRCICQDSFGAGFGADVRERCEASPFRAWVEQGRASYDPESARAVLDSIYNGDCSLEPTSPRGGPRLVEGTLAPGEPCDQSGWSFFQLCGPTSTCAVVGSESRCMRLAQEGQRCDWRDSELGLCVDGLFCTDAGRCERLRAEGQTCESSAQCDGVGCVESLCRPAGGEDAACEVDQHCITRHTCVEGRCAAWRGPGEACSSANECESAICEAGACVGPAPAGSSCQAPTPSSCASDFERIVSCPHGCSSSGLRCLQPCEGLGSCDAGRCSSLASTGEPCSSDADCVTETCRDGLCRLALCRLYAG